MNAVFCVVAGVCCFQLPDTTGFPLPNTFEDVTQFHRKQKGFLELAGAHFDPLKESDKDESSEKVVNN